ncbi:NADH dehydrogenase I subunit J [Candidatus Kinetoplastibacterium blastocrithidii TCC012E]|uniref:NADH-quinone oxidoreductase subunit J n=1 Tax=Candidatus Kinetoplastidibacterium blastocrithidiae TCC012E TaxID=1208922 RepID=M1LBU5_9PROT|nr:NADH-quinone oxidoreductase subunit J [Candidatus Kinetoplastibacterium blastocrithidii]AFZ83798.1 NADH-quinone oxidoreductase subunit J [Candidatus Kinetoplastibacterium blastocrithidii (ex Strigomonas culicis)]AGF49923.1 NADH dehydrogenase I subunit J [Candidatus Kinetoplastibacterium blastocrithidii TCC012E]
MTSSTLFFHLLSSVTLIASLCVIFASNPVVSVLYLILVFINIAILWMMLGAEFLSLLLILVYVGAVMVLFLFVVMMIDSNSRNSDKENIFKPYVFYGIFIGILIIVEISIAFYSKWGNLSAYFYESNIGTPIAIGLSIYRDYIFAVEICALILLVGMVAAIVLNLRVREDRKVHNNTNMALLANPKNRLIFAKFSKNHDNNSVDKSILKDGSNK